MMEDPEWAWPYWKFGLKRDDLFSTLHDQYNTFPSSIQDPEAFHHDVYEISHEASSASEFHRLMADRKQQRLHELNESLELASVEIIANPSLIGTAQWQYALQLFRAKSLDSLVRYFASYLPDDHPWHRTDSSSASVSETSSTDDPLAHSHATSFFDDHDEKPMMTREPLCISTSIPTQLPPSPRSMTMQSDDSLAASPVDLAHHNYILNNLTPARTLSFSESESDRFCLRDSHHLDDASHGDPGTPTTSISDISETRSLGEAGEKDDVAPITVVEEDADTQLSFDLESMESETPTPKPETAAGSTSFFDAKPALRQRLHRSCSPSRPHPLSQSAAFSHPNLEQPVPSRLRRRDVRPTYGCCRRSSREPAPRIQKPLPDPIRSRPRGRRRLLEC